MAYNFTAASSQYLNTTASPLGTGQLGNHTISMILRGAPANPISSIFSISRSSDSGGINNPAIVIQNNNGLVRYFLRSNSSPDGTAWNGNNSNTAGGLEGGTAFDNSSHHLCCTLSSSTSLIYVDGVNTASNTAASVPTQIGMDRLGIGAFVRGNVLQYYSGQIAEVGIWNAALTAAEIASLAKGMTCDKIRPQSLVFHAPLVRDLNDQKGGLTITNNGGATVANHPRIYP